MEGVSEWRAISNRFMILQLNSPNGPISLLNIKRDRVVGR